MLVELKNGETLNGHLVNCDTWMNLTLKEVVQTSPEGDKFWRLPECYVRGNNVWVFRIFSLPVCVWVKLVCAGDLVARFGETDILSASLDLMLLSLYAHWANGMF